jgi:tRNA (adenine57-N1/adenine58-N1)-methyltransferase
VTARLLGAGDVVLLHDRAGRRYRLTLADGASWSTHAGRLAHDSLIGQPEGTVVQTEAGRALLALRPTFAEQVQRRRRGAGSVSAKDLAAIVLHADVSPGDQVVVAGSAGLALAALRAVGPSGRVVSYEARDEEPGEAPANLEQRASDLCSDEDDAVADGSVDRVLLVLPEPWHGLPRAAAALRPGGALCAACVNAPQVQRFCEAMRELGGFGLIETVEVLERGWTVRGRSLRPAHRMVGHTAFLTFARRLPGSEVFEAEREGF